jgi:hypothetical protein
VLHSPSTGNRQNKESANIKCLKWELGLYDPEKRSCTLAYILQVSGSPLDGRDTILPQRKTLVSGVAPESPVNVQLGWDLVTKRTTAYRLYQFHAHQTIQWPLMPCGWEHCHCQLNIFYIHDPKHDGMLIAQLTQQPAFNIAPAFNILCISSVSVILTITSVSLSSELPREQ